MSDWGFLPDEYAIVAGEMSHRKRLVVEGSTDKNVFTILLDQFHEYEQQLLISNKIDRENIDIDCIDDFIKKDKNLSNYNTSKDGNRGKIESIHDNIKSSPKYTNLVFFVDREFRNFNLDSIEDNLKKHEVKGSLIWSRGHSIENYLFDCAALHEALRELTKIEQFSIVIETYKNIFNQTISLAVAISLTLKECEKLNSGLVDKLDCKFIDINSSEINFRLEDLISERLKKIKKEEADKIVVCFKKRYEAIKDNNIEEDTLRWICHGHIGIRMIIEVYKRCIIYNCEQKYKGICNDFNKLPKEMIQRINRHKKEEITEKFFNWWASKVVNDKDNKYSYPKEIIDKLR